MNRFSVVVASTVLLFSAATGRAQVSAQTGAPESDPAPVAAAETAPPPAQSLRLERSAPALVFTARVDGLPGAPTARRPAALMPLYGSAIALQGYDTYSTLVAVRKGARETNPLLSGAVNRPAVFVAIKSATTFGTIYGAERLWRSNRKGAAIALMIANNAVLTLLAVHSRSVLKKVQ